MQGEQDEQEELYFYGNTESLVPADDPYRRLDALLDFTWLRRETRDLYSSIGRPSIDPVVIAKLLIVAYIQGITSERELMRQVQVNLSYRRFLHYRLGEALPDHSSLSRGRQRVGERTVRKVFEYVLRLCLDAGLVGGELQSIDSTFVQANASLGSLRPRLVEAAAEQFTGQLFLINPEEAEDSPSPPPPKGDGRRNDRFVSTTDPDSGIYYRPGGKVRLGFLVHFAVDRWRQIITGVLTLSAQHNDAAQLVPLVDQVKEQGIEVEAVVADRGYSTGEVYAALAERGIEAFIPVIRKGSESKGRFGRDSFSYDAETDRFLCPNGAWLTLRQVREGERRYQPRTADCRECPLREQCTSGRVRTLTVSRYEEYLAAARQRQETMAGQRAARDRRICSERTFAEAKERHGLRRAHRRGQDNMAIQALLTATAINLKRYLQAQTRAFPAVDALRAALLAVLGPLSSYCAFISYRSGPFKANLTP